MKLPHIPSLFKCCRVDHTEGVTSIKIKSSCFDKPIIINIGSDVNTNELIVDFINKLSKPKTEQLNTELTASLNSSV